jgi:hypothetical protein
LSSDHDLISSSSSVAIQPEWLGVRDQGLLGAVLAGLAWFLILCGPVRRVALITVRWP